MDIQYKEDTQSKALEKLQMGNSKVSFEEWYNIWLPYGENAGLMDILIDDTDNIFVTGGSGSHTIDYTTMNLTLSKFNTSGYMVWEKIKNAGDNSNLEGGYGIANDSLNNLYIAGISLNITTVNADILLVKFNTTDDFEWSVSWGGSGYEYISDLAVDANGNIYVIGTTVDLDTGRTYMVLLKFNSSGDLDWAKTWGTTHSEEARDVVVDEVTGNIYVAAAQYNLTLGFYDIYLICYNSTGDVQWTSKWDSGYEDSSDGIILNSNGDIYLLGQTDINDPGNYDVLLIKYNSSGVELWNRTWGGSLEESPTDLVIDSSDNVYITGRTESLGTNGDVLILKYHDNGDLQYALNWGNSSNEGGFGIALDSSDNIYIAGFSGDMNLLLKCKSTYDLTPPYITNVQVGNDPITVGDTQTITCEVADLSGILSVTAYIEYPDETVVATTVLYDDGLHNDGSSDDGVFGNTWDSTGSIGGTYLVDISALDNSTLQNQQNIDNGISFVLEEPPPIIAINSPAPSAIYGNTPPTYNLSITYSYTAIWYTLDDGITNITASGLTGTISQIEWNKLGDGAVTIKFYANNSAGFIGSNQIQIIKSTPSQTPPKISGYHITVLVGISFLVSVIIVKRKRKF